MENSCGTNRPEGEKSLKRGIEGMLLDFRGSTRMLLLAAALVALPSCGSGLSGHHVNGICGNLQKQVLTELGVKKEGIQTSSNHFDVHGRPLRVAVACECGDQGFVAGEASLNARRLAITEGILFVAGSSPIRGSADALEKEAACAGFPVPFLVDPYEKKGGAGKEEGEGEGEGAEASDVRYLAGEEKSLNLIF